ncbi:Reticulocyte-binding protein 2 homolog a [Durusdinium trenchii]|uniref:Reticulocyte-binding protein 2 homolog a n=1 Tax=Durusdinium trenchii TaxID=1381693 RepID=A0ABP0HDT2_9DINO
MAGRYQPADAAGRFNAEPRQAPREEASPYSEPFFDFDELDTDPSERKPGGVLARRLWSAEPQVRQWKWVSVGVLFLLAMLTQSVALYFATRRYVRWVGTLGVDEESGTLDLQRLELTLRLLQPRDTFAQALGVREVSKLPVDLASLAIPLLWLSAVVHARNLRLWTRTLLAASLMALFSGILGFLTMLPQPLGWEACEARLYEDVLQHYRGGEGPLPDVGEALGLIAWIWLQDVTVGMRLQGQLVCAGSSISGPTWFTTLFALALYDLSRMWSRKLKPHFREISHLAFAGVLTACILVDAGLEIVGERQYTSAVTMGLVLALLVYQSPALAVSTDRWLARGTPDITLPLPKGDLQHLPEPVEDTSRDLGDVVVPPCCVPFCAFHGRYFLYPQPASEYEQELLANMQAQAELEQLQKEQEQSTRRLLEIEGQMEALHQRQAQRVEEEPKEFERQLQKRLSQQREVFEQQLSQLQAETERAQEERMRLEEEAQAEARREELLRAAKVMPKLSSDQEGVSALQGDFRTLPAAAWQTLHARFAAQKVPEVEAAPSGAPAPGPAVATALGDFRVLPWEAWERMHQRFRPASAVASVTVLSESKTCQSEVPATSQQALVKPAENARPAHLRPSATPYISRRRR